jgi:hypothetical protein
MNIGGLTNLSTTTASFMNTTNPIGVGGYANGIYAFIGAMPYYSLYNRAITSTEILQNFNAIRGRFGI